MLNKTSKFGHNYHPNAPIESMPPFDQLLLPISAKMSICDQEKENLRVLVVLNVPWKNDIRMAIRETYANFNASGDGTNWTRMFLVGSPRNETETKLLEKENRQFGDIVVVNITENYFWKPTLKMLIGFKFVSCFCPNAEYFVKSDEDNVVNIAALDREIADSQLSADRVRSEETVQRLGHQSIYLGKTCGPNVIRNYGKSKWAVTFKEYPGKVYPPYIRGPLAIISMSTVRKMAVDCPYICTGLDPDFEQAENKTCFWKFEDVFAGSCVTAAEPNTVFDGGKKSMAMRSWNKNFLEVIKLSVKRGEEPFYVSEVKKVKDFFKAAESFNFVNKYLNRSIPSNSTQRASNN